MLCCVMCEKNKNKKLLITKINYYNMLICCSRNISYYYQCLKQLCYLLFFVESMSNFFLGFFGEYKVLKNNIFLKCKSFVT